MTFIVAANVIVSWPTDWNAESCANYSYKKNCIQHVYTLELSDYRQSVVEVSDSCSARCVSVYTSLSKLTWLVTASCLIILRVALT